MYALGHNFACRWVHDGPRELATDERTRVTDGPLILSGAAGCWGRRLPLLGAPRR